MDACFGDGHRLLFHDFVNRHAVDVRHLVEFVDTNDTTVSEDHGTSLEPSLAGIFVRRHRRRETDTGRTATCRRNCERSRAEHKPKHLRLCRRWVANHENIDVATDVRAVRQVLLGTS